MITLTTPRALQTVRATLVLTATASSTATPIIGTLSVTLPGGNVLQLDVPQLDISTKLTLTSPQATALLGNIETAQAALENGLISLGVVAGVRTAGV